MITRTSINHDWCIQVRWVLEIFFALSFWRTGITLAHTGTLGWIYKENFSTIMLTGMSLLILVLVRQCLVICKIKSLKPIQFEIFLIYFERFTQLEFLNQTSLSIFICDFRFWMILKARSASSINVASSSLHFDANNITMKKWFWMRIKPTQDLTAFPANMNLTQRLLI